MLKYFFDEIFPFKGDKYDQPEWFVYFWNVLENEKQKIMEEKRDGNKKRS